MQLQVSFQYFYGGKSSYSFSSLYHKLYYPFLNQPQAIPEDLLGLPVVGKIRKNLTLSVGLSFLLLKEEMYQNVLWLPYYFFDRRLKTFFCFEFIDLSL
jgi:hypothetical protein